MPSIHFTEQPQVSVGIVSATLIRFTLNGDYRWREGRVGGPQEVELRNGLIHWNGKPFTELRFEPAGEAASFSLSDVVIGVGFHWERKQTQTFLGELRFIVDGGKLTAINRLPVERYLESVVSSEMSATSSLTLLMAHAIISRTWLLAQMQGRAQNDATENAMPSASDGSGVHEEAARRPFSSSLGAGRGEAVGTLIRWYDHTDHTRFDVCADDHCQRYQGITMETSPNAKEAVSRTRGMVLTSDGAICDARFSKCCGGAMEEFQYCWDDAPKSYLKARGDNATGAVPDLRIEANADRWIRTAPESFCNTHDARILSQVLNDYDQETTDFYRWHVSYSQSQLSDLIRRKTGIDFGGIVDLVPVERGTSGRIALLKIVGTKRTMVIGKELEIRRALSESHLYSSAFVVDKQFDAKPSTADGAGCLPLRFILTGAGWGHGVGLCQIGAAVMAEKGYRFDEILHHYYPGADIETIW